MKIDCFNNQGTEIYYDENLKSIVATYKGMIKYDDWVEHLEHAIKLIQVVYNGFTFSKTNANKKSNILIKKPLGVTACIFFGK